MGGSQPACVHLTKLIEPDEWSAHPPILGELSYTSDVSTLIRESNATFWASSPRPDTTVSVFAVATSNGTGLVEEQQSNWSSNRIQTFKTGDLDASSEVLAVDWLDRNVLLNGCRDGTVRLWDVRTRDVSGISWRVRHPSCINHVRKLDANRIVVAGLEGRMAVYDLRYTRAEDQGGVTRPCVQFPGYRNRELNGVAVGFDVCGYLIAAGTDEGRLHIFDGATGREVMGGKRGNMLGGSARCVRFVEMEEERDGRRLFVADAEGIRQLAW